jgi:hypothetical protein
MPPLLRPTAPALRDATPRVLSACLFHWDAAPAALESVCGRTATYARAETLSGVTDGAGTTYVAPHSLPAWEMRDADGDSVREAVGLRLGTADVLSWPAPPAPQAMAGLLAFIETGALVDEDATVFAIANDAVTGARLWIDTSGSYYRLNYSDGTTTRTATLTAGQPTSGQSVRLRWTLSAAGVVSLWQSINGGAETTATAAALALPAAWGDGARVRLNSRGATVNPARGWYRRAKIVDGAPDVATLEVLR